MSFEQDYLNLGKEIFDSENELERITISNYIFKFCKASVY